MVITHTPRAVLNLPRRIKDIGPFAKAISTAMTANPSFPSPTPPLATLSADIAAFDAAEAAVLTRTKGAAPDRNDKLATLKSDLEHLVAYVQLVAYGNPATAETVIQSAGLGVHKIAARNKGDLVAVQGAVPGTVKLSAKAVSKRASYEWQYSADQKTWTNAPVTLQAKTVIVGLPSAATYFFRCRPVTKAGEGAYSQIVAIVTH